MATMVMIDFMILIFFLGLKLHAAWFEIRASVSANRARCDVVRAGMGAGTLHVNVYFRRCEAGRKLGLVLSQGFVWIAVQPMLARVRGRDYGVTAGIRVFAGVLIWRAVAAQRDSTCLAR